MPFFTDAPALYYRKDLLDKHGVAVPTTWEELTADGADGDGRRARRGQGDLWGYVWQGNAYEGLTCNALEWIKSNGGGQIIEPDGTITVNNENAVAALEMAKGWVGTISPPGVLSYMEEESRGVWQTGNAVFMRNWPYAYAARQRRRQPDQGHVRRGAAADRRRRQHARRRRSAAGTSRCRSSRRTRRRRPRSRSIMASAEYQKAFAIEASHLPTIQALYDDAEIAAAQPLIPRWKEIFLNAVPRPSAPTKVAYNEVSSKFWSAVHETLSGTGSAAENLEILELDLDEMKGGGW